MQHLRLTLIVAVGLFIAACSKIEAWQESQLDTGKQQILYGMRYGDGDRRMLDIALPKNRNTNTPVVVFIHGGAWVFGDKSVFAEEIKQFADQGIACATINYRFASESKGIQHPDLPNDVREAVDFIASKAEVWKVSPNRFGLVGHSAGGHLSLITAYTLNTNGLIKACANWAGPTNLIDSEQLAINGSREVIRTYMGTGLNNWLDTVLYKKASPYWEVNNLSVPTLLVHGTNDEAVPYSNAVQMKARLDTLGVTAEMLTMNGAAHVWTGGNLNTARQVTLQWFQGKL